MNTFIGIVLVLLVIILTLIYYFIYCIFSDIARINRGLQQDRETFIKICDNLQDVITYDKDINSNINKSFKIIEELIDKMDNYVNYTIKNIRFIKQNMIRRKKPIID